MRHSVATIRIVCVIPLTVVVVTGILVQEPLYIGFAPDTNPGQNKAK
jgi:hypothetical protein